jgi:hypothetical protein
MMISLTPTAMKRSFVDHAASMSGKRQRPRVSGAVHIHRQEITAMTLCLQIADHVVTFKRVAKLAFAHNSLMKGVEIYGNIRLLPRIISGSE